MCVFGKCLCDLDLWTNNLENSMSSWPDWRKYLYLSFDSNQLSGSGDISNSQDFYGRLCASLTFEHMTLKMSSVSSWPGTELFWWVSLKYVRAFRRYKYAKKELTVKHINLYAVCFFCPVYLPTLFIFCLSGEVNV